MPFDDPPQGVPVRAEHDRFCLDLLPYLSDHGQGDLRVFASAAAIGYVALRVSRLLDGGVFGLLAVGALALGTLVYLVMGALRRARRNDARLVVEVAANELRLGWSNGAANERVFLRDVGRVEAEEAGYQRYHVVAHVAGRDPLVIPMERHTVEAARWLAAELAAAGRKARERDGDVAQVPRALHALTEG
ncbi:MAG: hypothetical protein ABMA64_39105 [Myxococcota bacterium]